MNRRILGSSWIVGRREEVGLAERSAVGDQERRRVRDPRPGEQLDHVGEQRDDRQAVLVAAEAVERVRQVQLQVQAPLGRRHHLVLAAGLDHPLALAAVADHVRLQRVRAVVLLVPGDDPLDLLGRLEIGVGEDAGPGREGARADQLAGLDEVLIGEHVVRAGLRVAAGGHAVGEVGEEAPVLQVEHAAADLRPVGVGVDEAGHDRRPRDVDDLRPLGDLDRALRARRPRSGGRSRRSSPSSITSSPRIVMIFAPRSTIVPRGRCLGRSTTTAISSGFGVCSFFSASVLVLVLLVVLGS